MYRTLTEFQTCLQNGNKCRITFQSVKYKNRLFPASRSGPILLSFSKFLQLKSSPTLNPSSYTSLITAKIPFSTDNSDKKENSQRSLTFAKKFVLAAPPRLQPYFRLSRIDTPAGSWLLFWPCTWGLALGSQGIPSLELLTLFGIGSLVMRGAGCTINDMWDRRIDSAVSRTKSRPLASKELDLLHALYWLGIQLSVGLLIVLSLPAPCLPLSIGSLGLVILYPLAKRYTNWPQVVLGLTFNLGIIYGFTAASGALEYAAAPWLLPSVLSMYGAAVCWTVLYDTIYAHQDREDDALLGLGSTARTFGDDTKLWLSGCATAMISGLGITGLLYDLSWPYYAGITVAAAHIIWQLSTLDTSNPENCATRFRSNRQIGWIICAGLVGSKIFSP